jgi:predicted nucleic acid-binding protein
MTGKAKKYYWDSCSFIKWLDGKGDPLHIEGLAQVVKSVESGLAKLFTSALTTKTEVLKGKMNAEQRDRFARLFLRRNVVEVDVTSRVLAMSERIREWNSKISVPDTIHLATAIIYEADEFHTSDGTGKRKRAGDLLPLSGNVAGYNLNICTPTAKQSSLLFGVGPLPPAVLEVQNEKQQNAPETSVAKILPDTPQFSARRVINLEVDTEESAPAQVKDKGKP